MYLNIVYVEVEVKVYSGQQEEEEGPSQIQSCLKYFILVKVLNIQSTVHDIRVFIRSLDRFLYSVSSDVNSINEIPNVI